MPYSLCTPLGLKKIMNLLRYFGAGRQDELDKYMEIAMSAEGQISGVEARKLIELARNVPAGTVIVEIGTFRGRSTIALALGAIAGNANRVYAVDPHVEFQGVFGGQFGPSDQAELYRNLVRARVGRIVAVVSLSSQAAAHAWNQQNIGLLWIDGDHRYPAVSADYYDWSRFVVPSGLVAFHDASAPGVKQLVDELVGKGRLLPAGNVEALSWFRPSV
jgi:predicted O-methyltransferase YrrM